MAIPLKSDQFSNDKLLQRCATDNAAHLTPATSVYRESTGAHVGLVQDALIQLGLHDVLTGPARDAFIKEFQARRYGPRTAEVVKAFKTKPPPPIKGPILGPGQTVPDNIVGIRTIDALDELMLKLQGKLHKLDPIDPEPHSTNLLIFLSGFVDPGGAVINGAAEGSGFQMLNPMRKLATPNSHREFRAIQGSLNTLGQNLGWTNFQSFINAKLTSPPGKLIVYGYSAGGNNALEFCRRLESANAARRTAGKRLITVDLLITVDAARRDDHELGIGRTVAGCVVENVNFFQTTPSFGGARGGLNSPLRSALTGRVPKVMNINLDSELPRLRPLSWHQLAEGKTLARCQAMVENALK